MSSNSMGLKILAVVLILVPLLAGCANATPTPPANTAPTTAPTVNQLPTLNALGTQVAQTFAANLTLTVPPATAVPPTATLAPTSTPLPSVTPAPTDAPAPKAAVPTATPATVAWTPNPTPTLTTYSCGVISVYPSLSDRIKVGSSFTGSWRVENTGTEYWQATEDDIHYIMGEKFQTKGDLYDLGMTVGPTGSYTVNIEMKAPKLAGPYYAQWAIKYGQITICTLNLTVYVVK